MERSSEEWVRAWDALRRLEPRTWEAFQYMGTSAGWPDMEVGEFHTFRLRAEHNPYGEENQYVNILAAETGGAK